MSSKNKNSRHPLGKPPRRRPLRDLDTSFRNPGNEREDRSCWGATLKTSGETMPWVGTFETVLFWSKSLVILNMILQMPSNALLFFFIVEGKKCNLFFWKTWSPFSFLHEISGGWIGTTWKVGDFSLYICCTTITPLSSVLVLLQVHSILNSFRVLCLWQNSRPKTNWNDSCMIG